MSAAVGVVLLMTVAGCSGDEQGAGGQRTTTQETAVHDHAVGTRTMTFVDPSRPTRAHAGQPGSSDRTLVTTVLYPAEGPTGGEPTAGAPADSGAGPYPLVVLSHGLGGTAAGLVPIASAWSRAGYVVAVPTFPLTNADTPGGVSGDDVENQPGDVSFVIDQMLAASQKSGDPLAGIVDPGAVGIAGHSNGAITTVATVANSCCRDDRVKAAIVFAGTASPFSGGSYDFADTPPMLFVHGVDDALVAFNGAVAMFDEARPPKGFLSLAAAGHGAGLSPSDPAFPTVVRASTDFLDGTLRGDTAALDHLPQDQQAGVATMRWAPDDATTVVVDTVPTPETDRRAKVSAQDGLTDGQTVTVTWSGFLPGKTINVVQCTGDGRGGSATCDIASGRVLQPDPTGEGTMDITVHTGAVGNGVCDAAHPCTILVNDAGLQDADAFLYFPITFAG